jgi:hypothetical protein
MSRPLAVTTLESLFAHLRSPTVHLVKILIDGDEPEAIKGDDPALKKRPHPHRCPIFEYAPMIPVYVDVDRHGFWRGIWSLRFADQATGG